MATSLIVIGPLPLVTSITGFKNSPTIFDEALHEDLGWTETFPTKHETAQTVAKKLLEDILPRYGFPVMLGSDNRPAFVSKGMNSRAGSGAPGGGGGVGKAGRRWAGPEARVPEGSGVGRGRGAAARNARGGGGGGETRVARLVRLHKAGEVGHRCRTWGRRCLDGDSSFCECAGRYSGKPCQCPRCENSPCGNRATCVPKSGADILCLCPNGKAGARWTESKEREAGSHPEHEGQPDRHIHQTFCSVLSKFLRQDPFMRLMAEQVFPTPCRVPDPSKGNRFKDARKGIHSGVIVAEMTGAKANMGMKTLLLPPCMRTFAVHICSSFPLPVAIAVQEYCLLFFTISL
ncbi:uncharacterized protein LOC110350488 [Heterocephalus glaber]|uniref:Uncharacterized protein LOC110350488 n=1 Tax=Heterocephalus glaber TaxID=10181 RepID=A0AAX6TF88_HETGA|nr:uncharacterized protein LOC110350488 [Heterocephalus glaber]